MDLLTALWMVPLAAFVIVCGVLILLHRRVVASSATSPHRRYWISVLVLGAIVAALRIGICWWATYRAFIHQETLDEIPLIALLMPEYLITPGDPASPSGMWTLTAALVIGSFVAVSVLALLVWRFGQMGIPVDVNGHSVGM